MVNNFYYPKLARQDIAVYYKEGKEFYATYNSEKNYINVSKDCLFRCVYCDAHVNECGGERFSLDHFRPTNIFSNKFNGVLNFHPFNLYLSCQKCNVLKTNDWKGCVDTIDGVAHASGLGYIDRFSDDITKYIAVDETGAVVSINSDGPGEYMVRRLLLNRTNRIYIRKRRVVKDKAARVFELLLARQNELVSSVGCSIEGFNADMKKLIGLFERFKRLELLKV